jgi:cytoskeleton protein RodZ
MPFALAKSEKRSKSAKSEQTDGRHTAETQSAPSPNAPAMGSLGSELRVARLEKNLTLRQVADDTHISLRHLQNLEEGRYAELPGGIYNRAFLRSFCNHLGLDAEKFVERYESEAVPASEKLLKAKTRAQQLPAPPIYIPQVLVWFVILLVSVTGLFFSRHWIADVFSPYFSQPPATRIPLSQPPPKAADPAAGAPVQKATETPAQSTEPAATAPKPTIPEQQPGTIRLQFTGVQDCWMSLTSDGNRVFSRVLQPGESPVFDAKERFEMVLGNAGGVTLTINGKPAKPLGAPGSVLKLIIDAQSIPDLLAKQ